MANPFKTFLNALIGKDTGTENPKEIKQAEQKGEIVATKAAENLGFVEQVKIDAAEARKAAEANVKEKTIKEERGKE